MRRERTVVRKERVVDFRCDVCGDPAKYTCQLCGRDLCRGHVVEADMWRHDMTEPVVDGDYPGMRVCRECWDDGGPERAKITGLNASHEAAVESLYGAWFKRRSKR